MSTRLYRWLESVFDDGGRVYLKRLSGNDTQLTGSHQAGPYFPKKIIFDLFPSLTRSDEGNPRTSIPMRFISDAVPDGTVMAIWYRQKTRDECRITGWGGRDSPLLDPEATGSLAALCFKGPQGKDADGCEVWVCSSPEEEDIFEDRFGPVEPGAWLYIRQPSELMARRKLPGVPDEVRDPTGRYFVLEPNVFQLEFEMGRPVDRNCRLTADQLPTAWLSRFPSGEDLIAHAANMRPDYLRMEPDTRVVKRRDCEYEVFLSVEEVHVLPAVEQGFPTVDEFIRFANSVTNRRKARSGRSLELQAKRIFDEEKLASYSHDAVSEDNKRPDFLFPSADAYYDGSYPSERLRMLAAKTTCKDRWRQVVDEARRIDKKHLLTLQEGVSGKQFAQMQEAGIVLVVPKPLHKKYPDELRNKLVSFESFLDEVRQLI